MSQKEGNVEVMVEGASGHMFESRKWQHLTLTFTEDMHVDRTCAHVCRTTFMQLLSLIYFAFY